MVERFLELWLKFEIESTYRSLLTNTHYFPLGSYKHFHLGPHMKQRDFLIQYFYENGKVELEYTIKNDVLIGEVKRYYSDGSLREEQKFDEKGNATTYKTYKQSEKTVKPEAATSNEIFPPTVKNPKTKGLKFVPNGYNKIYNLSEEIWMDGEFKNGQLWDGKVFDYDKDGILLKVRVFKNGKYHSDGQL